VRPESGDPQSLAGTARSTRTYARHRSSYSNGSGSGSGGECVEVAALHPDVIPVRASKRTQDDAPVLLFRPLVRTAFLSSLKDRSRGCPQGEW